MIDPLIHSLCTATTSLTYTQTDNADIALSSLTHTYTHVHGRMLRNPD